MTVFFLQIHTQVETFCWKKILEVLQWFVGLFALWNPIFQCTLIFKVDFNFIKWKQSLFM